MNRITRITIDIEKLAEEENSYRNLLRIIEPVYLATLLQKNDGNQSQSAKMAGINRATLVKKLWRYNMTNKGR